MAKVDRAETPITVNKVAFSFWAWLGNAADNANAAEAPQIAVAPPVNIPKSRLKPSTLAETIETEIVTATSVITKATGCQPKAVICPKVIRIPSKAIPMRNTVRAVNSIPALQRPSTDKKFSPIPSNKANSITGAP
ncbi:hypothetical protein D9M72_92580 [compost metagenome]